MKALVNSQDEGDACMEWAKKWNPSKKFLKMEFKSKLAQQPGTKCVYSVRECCCDMSTDKELCELTCLHIMHMEADTILFFIYFQLRKSGVSDAVVIDDEDTDVVVLASYVAHQIEGPLGLKRKNNIFDCSALLHKDIS